MNKSTIILILAIVISGVAGFVIGRNSKTTTSETQQAIAVEQADLRESEPDPAILPDSQKDVTPSSEQDISSNSSNPVQVKDTLPIIRPVNAEMGQILAKPQIGISLNKISEVLESISDSLENEKLAYVVSQGQDCSGIFHKIKNIFQKRLPALKEGSQYTYPTFKKDRSSRQIADWYHQKGNLLIVEDPISSKNSIRPGSVMFFGQAGKLYKDMTIEMLTDRDNGYTKDGAIQHVAVVTSVRTDQNGDLVDYTMMHARYPNGPHASRSGSKAVQSTSARNKALVAPYPFGHWTQQWVAVANIVTFK